MAQRYDTYKDSGVQWLGEIPRHWGCVPVRRIAYVNPTRKKNLEADSYVGYAPMERIRCDKMNPSKIKVSKLTSGLTYCEEGDIVLAKVTPCFENGNLAIVPHIEQGCCYASSELFVFRAKDKVLPRFLFYTFLNRGFINAGASTMHGTGGLKRVTTEFANSAATPLPPLSEQHSIVTYLNGKCGKIDEWLEKKQNEVEHLQELKQRVIADAVTQGIDPNVTMKQTGVFWWKETPEHWQKIRLGYILQKMNRMREPNSELLVCTNKGKVIKRGETKIGLIADSEEIYQGVAEGDLLIHGMDTWHGAIAVSNFNGMCTPVVHVCTSNENLYFVAYYMQVMAYSKIFKLISNGVRQNTSDFRSWSKVDKIPIMLPPKQEQDSIVSYISDKTTKIDKLIANINKEIEGIKEYKQRLISDVVTGQIKVC